jgi:hypothetical protein
MHVAGSTRRPHACARLSTAGFRRARWQGLGLYFGLSIAESFLREQQRQVYLQNQLKVQQELGRDQAQIAQLQRELAEQNAKVDGLKQQNGGVAPQVDAETEVCARTRTDTASACSVRGPATPTAPCVRCAICPVCAGDAQAQAAAHRAAEGARAAQGRQRWQVGCARLDGGAAVDRVCMSVCGPAIRGRADASGRAERWDESARVYTRLRAAL